MGQAISDPFGGDDPEDFALPSFLNTCAKHTFHVAFAVNMDAPHAPVRGSGGADEKQIKQLEDGAQQGGAQQQGPSRSVDELLNTLRPTRAAISGPSRSIDQTFSALGKGMGHLEA